MTRIGQLAPYLDGIPIVASSAQRDLLSPSPDTNQRVQNVETGYIERYDGQNWAQEIPVNIAGPVISVLAKGAKGDGSTDDTTAWQAVADALTAAGGGTMLVPFTPSGYVINRVQITSSNITVQIDPTVGIKRTVAGVASQAMLECSGTVTATSTTLSSSAALGATSLSVSSESGFSAGDYVEIYSSLQLGGDTYRYEINRVDTTSSGVINLKWATRNAYSTSGQTITVTKIVPLENITISGGIFTGPGTLGDCVRINRALFPRVDAVTVTNHGQAGVVLNRCLGGAVSRSLSHDGGSSSYGFSVYACEGTTIERCTVRDTPWDGFDFGHGSMYCMIRMCRAIRCQDVGFISGHGQHAHDITFDSCHAVRCGTGFQVGNLSYENDDENVFWNCIDHASTNGFMIHQASSRNRFIRCVSHLAIASGFKIAETTAVDNAFLECISDTATDFGLLVQGRALVRGGRYINTSSSNANGIRVTGSAASDTILDNVDCSSNGKHGIYVTGGALRVQINHPRTWSAGNSGHGIFIDNGTDCHVIEPNSQSNAGWGVLISDVGGNCARSRVVGGVYNANGSGTVNSNNAAEQSADNGDTSPTVVVDTNAPIQRFDTVLTANRTCTLSRTNVRPGARFRIVRTGLGAFTLTVQDATGPTTLKVIPNSTAAYVDAEYNNSAWVLIGYGTL